MIGTSNDIKIQRRDQKDIHIMNLIYDDGQKEGLRRRNVIRIKRDRLSFMDLRWH